MNKTENKILKKFEATDVIIEIIDGVPMFELYSTGAALGYTNKRTSKGKEYISPYKSRIDKTAKNAGITGLCQGGNKYINIDDVRKLISFSHTNNTIKELFVNYLKERGFLEYTEVFVSNKKEINFLNGLEKVLKPLHIQGIRQYHILKYRIDYYIPQLKLAIEYDENDHKSYTYESQELRQKLIEKALGCQFIRLSDSNDNFFNIGIVFNKIMEIIR